MKVNKNFTLDLFIVEKLKEFDNSSKLINDLLIDFFKSYNKNFDELEQNICFLKQNRAKIKEISSKVKVFKQLKLLKADENCIKWCVANKDQELENIEDLIQKEYSVQYRENKREIRTETYLKVFKIIKKNGDLFKKTK
jgi:hypothetical protein